MLPKSFLSDDTTLHFRTAADVSILKVDSADNSTTIEGVEFTLKGTSDYGTDVNKVLKTDNKGRINFKKIDMGSYTLSESQGITSDSGKKVSLGTGEQPMATDSNGLIAFSDLKSGTYILQETSSPENFTIDNTKYIVKVSKDKEVEIEGLEKDSDGSYLFVNKPNTTVTVTVNWLDNKSNETRPNPNLHIISKEYHIDTKTYFQYDPLSRISDSKSATGSFLRYTDSDVKSVLKSTTADTVTLPSGITAYRVDRKEDGDNVYWWSLADKVYLTDSTHTLFKECKFTIIDLTDLNTSEVTNMSQMFYNCYRMTSIDLSSFNAPNCTTMESMLQICFMAVLH